MVFFAREHASGTPRRTWRFWRFWAGLMFLCGVLPVALWAVFFLNPLLAARQQLDRFDPALPQTPSTTALLSRLAAEATVSTPAPPPTWQGPGRKTLAHLWPFLQQQDRQRAGAQLSLQLAQYRGQPTQSGYEDFPNRYAITLGQPAQLRLSLARQGALDWQVVAVCAHRPQPLLELKRCPSDSR